MNYLAIDTSGAHLSVILRVNGKYYGRFLKDCNLQHSVTLMPEIERAVEESGCSLRDIDVFCACVGAGSFTGIRIGVATIKAFSYSLNKKVLPITSFDCLAYNKEVGKKIALIDAHHGSVYSALYDGEKLIKAPSFITTEEAKSYFSEYKPLSYGGVENLETFDMDVYEGLKNAVEANLDKATADREILVPLYVRKSQAEENAQ